ncbi:MAG: SEL1-like repeat protein [Thermoguttaceae bacterium]|nr:SEL1-like repeat protein [Thermoguttaceae bacterium]
MKSRLFHSTVVFLLTLFVAPLCIYAQEEDILIEPPLTWSINSIQIVWSVSQGATTTQETKFIYGADKVNSETFGKELSNEKGTTAGVSGGGGARVDANAKLESNPFTLFGLMGAKVNASSYVEGGFNYNQTNRNTDTSLWSESEKNVVSQALSSAFEQSAQQTISNQRLLFTVDFVNHTSTRLYFSPNSANTIPVYCGNVHIGDARLISENASIAATGKPIPCQFEMALNDTGKQSLVNNRPIIRIDGGQLLIQSLPSARERIDDAVQESTVATSYFTIAILSGNEVKEWKIRWFRKNPVTLLEALEAINENIREISNDDNKTIFSIEDQKLVSVCDVPFTDKGDPDWITELKVFKGANAQIVSDPDLSETPRRGERYVFQLVSQEIKKLKAKGKAGDAEAIFELAMKYYNGNVVPEDKVKAVKLFQKAAELGNVKAQCNLAICYMKGYGVPVDKAEAVKWLRKAAEQGNVVAQFSLGLCYMKGDGVPEDKSEAVKWWHKAAEQGNVQVQNNLERSYCVQAQYSLGLCYYMGDGVSRDKSEAVKWFRIAAEQGNSEAKYYLGSIYLYGGDGIPIDKKEGINLLRQAAEQGVFGAQNKLGFIYSHGDEGIPKDMNEAVKWYRLAAEQGNSWAQFNLAMCYLKGEGVSQNYNEAVKWFREASNNGFIGGDYNLGLCYYNGIGVPQDYDEAVKWFQKAANQGHIYAQFYLGVCYANGSGVPQDYNEAVKWYRKVAEKGVAEAQYNLGACYYNGNGVPQDDSEAVKWLRKAAEQGDEKAIKVLKEMNESY